jgi:flagellar motor switch protein FliM
MSKSTDESKNIFTECKKNAEKFFNEVDKSTPIYHQTATNIQQSFMEAWKNVINSSIALQQEFASKSGLNVNMNEETMKAIQNITDQAITAYKNQNKFTIDSAETSKKIFDAFNENTKTLASLNKNMIELMLSAIKQKTQN